MSKLYLSILLFIVCVSHAEPNHPYLSFGKTLTGSWFNPDTSGQGLLIDYDEDSKLIFAGWFTFLPNTTKRSWFTLSGHASSDIHQLDIISTTGGAFNSGVEVNNEIVGTAQLKFTDCNHAQLDYNFNNEYGSGSIPLQRIMPQMETLCDALIQADAVPFETDQEKTVIYKDVHLISLDDSVLGSQVQSKISVKVNDGLIQEISAYENLNIPDGSIIIDGRGRYLIPGLADMHTHLATNVREFIGSVARQNVIQTSAENQLMLYLANGVTTILNNGDFGEPLPQWSSEVIAGTLIGPTIYSAKYARGGSNTCDGGPAVVTVNNDPNQARSFVQQAKAAGYDFIKTYNCTPTLALQTILDFSEEAHMPVIGHLPQTMGAQETLERGMVMVAHAEAYVWTLFNYGHPINQIPQAVSITKDNNAWVTGTLSILNLIAQVWGNNTAGIEAYWNRPETQYMHPTTKGLNNRSITSQRFNPAGATPGGYDPRRDFVFILTKAFHDADIKLLMGTDSPTVLGVPGFSAYSEMLALESTGISKQDVLKISTKNAGDFIKQQLPESESFGSIEIGSRADLILLSSNPLENLDFKENILGVMGRGHWYSIQFFDEKLQAIAQSYGN